MAVRSRIEPVESFVGADPEASRPIFEEAPHIAVADGVQVGNLAIAGGKCGPGHVGADGGSCCSSGGSGLEQVSAGQHLALHILDNTGVTHGGELLS